MSTLHLVQYKNEIKILISFRKDNNKQGSLKNSNFPLKRTRCPLKKSSCPHKRPVVHIKVRCPLKRSSCPLIRTNFPLKKSNWIPKRSSFPLKRSKSPPKRSSFLLKRSSFPLKRSISPPKRSSCPLKTHYSHKCTVLWPQICILYKVQTRKTDQCATFSFKTAEELPSLPSHVAGSIPRGQIIHDFNI